MQTQLAPQLQGTVQGDEGAAILRNCVHCGFCTATCPTYQLLGDELDGPRGRIYLIKQVLEGVVPTARTQLHLDRCLTCRACETTCPSGVQYGRLLDIGRRLVDEQVPRPAGTRLLRSLLTAVLTGPLFAPLLRLGRALRPLVPARLQPPLRPAAPAGQWPATRHARRMLLLAGCVQPAMAPNINAATARVLDRLGIELIVAPTAGCCGSLRHHLDDQSGALAQARRNIDAWWPEVQAGAEAIVLNASGCGTMLREYGHLLRDDALYAAKAAHISSLTRDLAELLPPLLGRLQPLLRATSQRVAFHSPCSLQHGQRIRGAVEGALAALGATLLPVADSHLCCGSAGAYFLLQPAISRSLRDAKVAALTAAIPDVILSANLGCITQLASGTGIPVQHWIEWLDSRLN
ncbi:MAG: glycolate oxidase subunit GlcF [Pseudomonadota bacterium]